MSQNEQWQANGNAAEMEERYLVPALFRPWTPIRRGHTDKLLRASRAST